jgi:hypothetical protein
MNAIAFLIWTRYKVLGFWEWGIGNGELGMVKKVGRTSESV